MLLPLIPVLLTSLVFTSCSSGKKQYPKSQVSLPEKIQENIASDERLSPTLPEGGVREGSYKEISDAENESRNELLIADMVKPKFGLTLLNKNSEFTETIQQLPRERFYTGELYYYEGFAVKWDRVNQKSVESIYFFDSFKGKIDLKSYGTVKMGQVIDLEDITAFKDKLFTDLTGIDAPCEKLCYSSSSETFFSFDLGDVYFKMGLDEGTKALNYVELSFPYPQANFDLNIRTSASEVSVDRALSDLEGLSLYEDYSNADKSYSLYSNRTLSISAKDGRIEGLELTMKSSFIGGSPQQYQGSIILSDNLAPFKIGQTIQDPTALMNQLAVELLDAESFTGCLAALSCALENPIPGTARFIFKEFGYITLDNDFTLTGIMFAKDTLVELPQ